MKRGAYILVVGPSGSGKNTLIAAAREAVPGLAFAVSATTRAPRAGEADGIDYHFLAREEFERRVSEGAFLEWAEYGGNLYGTLRSEVEAAIAEGRFVLSDIEIQGVRQVLKNLPAGERATIFIDAGSWEELVARITARGPMTEEEVAKRHAHYDEEAAFKGEADFVVQNRTGALDAAKRDFVQAVRSVMERA